MPISFTNTHYSAANIVPRPVAPSLVKTLQPVSKSDTGNALNNQTSQGPPQLKHLTKLTGPPPAFAASILDAKTDLSTSIKQFAASRYKAAQSANIAPAKPKSYAPELATEKAARAAKGLSPPATPADLLAIRNGAAPK